jgi:UDP-glucose 4-epimerase
MESFSISNNPLKKNILLTGGNGYIGSHTIIEILKNNDYNIIVIDNLSNSKENNLKSIKQIIYPLDYIFYEGDILDKNLLEKIFKIHNIYAVIHFAALKSVNDSIKDPILYYENNVSGTLNLLNVMKEYNVKNLIFSSSCTVYGNSISPFTENSIVGVGITNPYGRSKYLIEEILKDLIDWNIFILRYFNPVGAHESGLIGDDPNGIPTNLLPFLLRVAKNNYFKENNFDYEYLKIFGNDYDTYDGTCIRDFIHVVDLANAHFLCLNKFSRFDRIDVKDQEDNNCKKGINIINIGTGKGTSIMEFVNIFKNTLSIDVPYKILNRREGDVKESYCNNNKAIEILKWNPTKNITDICKDSWNFIIKNKIIK